MAVKGLDVVPGAAADVEVATDPPKGFETGGADDDDDGVAAAPKGLAVEVLVLVSWEVVVVVVAVLD